MGEYESDYCYARPPNYIHFVGNDDDDIFPLGRCDGKRNVPTVL